MKDVIFGLVATVLGTVATGVMGYLGVKFSKILDKRFDTQEKKEIVKTGVRFVEQVYATLDGPTKKQKAIEYITATLAEAGIPITELELEGLLEAAVKEFNDSGWKTTVGLEVSPEDPVEEVDADG